MVLSSTGTKNECYVLVALIYHLVIIMFTINKVALETSGWKELFTFVKITIQTRRRNRIIDITRTLISFPLKISKMDFRRITSSRTRLIGIDFLIFIIFTNIAVILFIKNLFIIITSSFRKHSVLIFFPLKRDLSERRRN